MRKNMEKIVSISFNSNKIVILLIANYKNLIYNLKKK